MIKIVYEDIAPGSSSKMTVTATNVDAVSNLERVPFSDANDLSPVSTEYNFWVLGKSYQYYPNDDNYQSQMKPTVGYWSSTISDENCEFDTPEVITVNLDGNFTSTGVEFSFNPETYDWCTDLDIQWFNDDTVLQDTVTFHPDAALYYCKKTVQAYNKLIITIRKTSKPFRHIRIRSIRLGRSIDFTSSDILSHSCNFELSPASLSLPISKLVFTVYNADNIAFLFQQLQPVHLYNSTIQDSEEQLFLFGTFYISSFERKNKNAYMLNCVDAIGVVADWPYTPTVYDGADAQETVNALFTPVGSSVPEFIVNWSDWLDGETITGYIGAKNVREALQQILLVMSAASGLDFKHTISVSTFATSNVNVVLAGEITRNITDDNIYYNSSVKTEAVMTEFLLTYHTYTQTTESTPTKPGDDIVKIMNGTTATYYMHTKKVASIAPTDDGTSGKSNIKSITNATLVNTGVGGSLLRSLYDELNKRNSYEFDFVWDKAMSFGQDDPEDSNQGPWVFLGNNVKVNTVYGEAVEGVIEYMGLTISSIVKVHARLKYPDLITPNDNLVITEMG
jgi:hypothetical protein